MELLYYNIFDRMCEEQNVTAQIETFKSTDRQNIKQKLNKLITTVASSAINNWPAEHHSWLDVSKIQN